MQHEPIECRQPTVSNEHRERNTMWDIQQKKNQQKNNKHRIEF